MKPTIDVYCGSPIEIESEKLFLGKLRADLLARGESALIFANFIPDKNPHQIDFLVVTARCACHVELKKLTAPIVGKINGPWSLILPEGKLSPLETKNPYRQALDGKFAISDEMHVFARSDPSIPQPAAGAKFYKHLESVVCIYPELLPGSSVYEDHKVRVRGYPGLLTLLSTQQTRPAWTREQWLAFAMHLSLVRTDDAEDPLVLELKAAQQAVADYQRRFQSFYRRELPVLVPTPVKGEQGLIPSDALLDSLLQGGHIQLLGPSGCGKSLLAKYMALTAISAGRLAVIAPAKEYEGKLSTLLDRSVAHLHPDTALRFFSVAARNGNSINLILDGFNECPPKWREQLIKDLQALYLRWTVPILITSQDAVALPEPLLAKALHFTPLPKEQKVAVLRSYAGDRVPPDSDSLWDPFQSPYELSLAAECLAEVGSIPTRPSLFEAYVRRRLEQTSNPTVTRRVISALAERMHKQLVSSLPIPEMWRLAASALERESGPMHLLTEALNCGLLEVRQGRCAFRHELLEQFFQAEALVYRHSGDGAIAQLLTLPRNRGLVEFVLGIETDPRQLRQVLQATADPRVLGDCLRGRFGETSTDVVTEDCSRLLSAAERSLEEADVELTGTDKDRMFLIIKGGPAWSAYDRALMEAVGDSLSVGLFLDETFRLIRHTEETCRLMLAGKTTDGIIRLADINYLFAGLYVWEHSGSNASFPASTIYRASRFHFERGINERVRDTLVELADSLDSRMPGELLLFCELLRQAGPTLLPALPQLLRVCWNTKIYHLRLDALQVAQRNAKAVVGEAREQLMTFLSSLHSNNVFLSSAIVEALCAYDMIPPLVSTDDVARELDEILASQDDAVSQRRAYGAVSNIFEDVFQGAFWEVIEGLAPAQRVQLLTMAALGAPSYAFATDWIMEELLKSGDEKALPAFVRWAQGVDAQSVCPQEATRCLVVAVMGCAKFLRDPLPFVKLQTENDRAWETSAAILYWMHRPGLPKDEMRSRCAPLWERLRTELAFEAVDPFFRMEVAAWKPQSGRGEFLHGLCANFPEEFRAILEFGLNNRSRLTSIFGRFHLKEEVAPFIIRWLAVVGKRQTLKLLEPLVDSPDLGLHALEAVRKLKAAGNLT
jgi:hypothetical protein